MVDARQGPERSRRGGARRDARASLQRLDHVDDPLGGLQVTASGFGALCREVVQIAEDHAQGRIVLVLEGGYDLGALRGCAVACADALSG